MSRLVLGTFLASLLPLLTFVALGVILAFNYESPWMWGAAVVMWVMTLIGATGLLAVAVVVEGRALARSGQQRGRLLGAGAIVLSVFGVTVGVSPLVLAALALCLALVVATLAASLVPAPMGRPLGGGGRARFLDDPRQIWRARAVDEARSVDAFLVLARDLEALGAPDALVARCRMAAVEEAQHAHLASARAGEPLPPLPPLAWPPPADLAQVVQDSVRDGCFGEALAAALLAAEGARDPEARPVLARIARDEAGHAELAWDIVRWGARQPAGRSALAQVRVPRLALTPSSQLGVFTQLRAVRAVRRDVLRRRAVLLRGGAVARSRAA